MPGPLARLGHPVEAPQFESRPQARGSGDAIARAASSFVGEGLLVVDGERFRMDCSGLVEAALAQADVPHSGSSAMLHEEAASLGVLHHRRLPRPGDVAFFDNTYDRNGNGLLDDPLSHTAVVERVFPNGTVEMVHVGSKGVSRLRMNLRRPSDRLDEAGETLNDFSRQKKAGDPATTLYLAGELWVAFASFYGSEALARAE